MHTTEAVGYLASSLVLTTFCMRSMPVLRTVAIASNLAFIAYGYLGGLMPILVLHTLLLPVNIGRLIETAFWRNGSRVGWGCTQADGRNTHDVRHPTRL